MFKAMHWAIMERKKLIESHWFDTLSTHASSEQVNNYKLHID
jgi:hypothetical protein